LGRSARAVPGRVGSVASNEGAFERRISYKEEVVVIDTFDDSTEALRRCSELHREETHREYCFFYTSDPSW
jgi:hypothetical protein